MSDPVSTVSETASDAEGASWWLYVAFHADPAFLGVARRCLPGARCEVSRGGTTFGAGALENERISRNHAVIEADATDAITVSDLGSSNGTYVNGRRVERQSLAPGQVVRFGSVLLVVRRARASVAGPAGAPWCGPSEAAARARAGLESALAGGLPVALLGEHGCGALESAREALGRRGGPWREEVLEGCDETLPPELVEAAGANLRGVMLSRGLPRPGSAAERGLRELLGSVRGRPDAPWMVFDLAGRPDAQGTLRARAETFGLITLELPALSTRSEDLGALARAWCEARSVSWPLGGYKTWQALLCASWPGNLPQFEAVLDALAAAPDADALDVASLLARTSWSEVEPTRLAPALATSTQRITVASDGRWFRSEGGDRVSLHRRPVLARLLGALARQRIQRPTTVIASAALIAEIWPGERMVEGSGDNRLHVALTHLRQLGLRGVIERVEDGYRLSPSVTLELANG